MREVVAEAVNDIIEAAAKVAKAAASKYIDDTLKEREETKKDDEPETTKTDNTEGE